MTERFRRSGCGSFFGDRYIYGQVVPKDHFLRQLKDLVDWQKLTEGLANCYKGGAEYGPSPYHPATLLKMLLLSYLYDLSERQTAEFVGDSLAAKYFGGLGVDELPPDHSSLSVFKERIVQRRGPKAFEGLFQQVAREEGIRFGRIQVVDATHSLADVDVSKGDEGGWGRGKPRDGEAAWGSKGRKRVRTAESLP